MKKIFSVFATILFTTSVYAGPESVLGGKPLSTSSAHNVGLGWPSVSYEWWHSGSPDWAIGGELVYGDWSGDYSDIEIGGAINVPFKWHLNENGRADIGFQLKPGGLIGSVNAPGDDEFIFGARAEVGVPITVDLEDRVNLITGVNVPFTVMFIEDADDVVIIPILPRIGVEFAATDKITPYILVELGPTIGITDSDTDVDFGVRAWVGSVFF